MDEDLKKILVVEDESSIQQVMCFFLQQHKFAVRAASNGQEAILAIPEFQPDLIILDLMMRPVSGWDVLDWLHTHSLNPPVPVLVLSALVNMTEQMQGFEQGAIEYITKPTQPSVIVERVKALLSMSIEQRLMLKHKRLNEQRRRLERLNAPQSDEFVY